jgi:hypothetical protein
MGSALSRRLTLLQLVPSQWSLLLLAVNLYAARDACGRGDWSRGLAVCGASLVLRTSPCDGVRPRGYGYRESAAVTYGDREPRPVRLAQSDLSGQDVRVHAGRSAYSLERAGQSPRRTRGALGR